MERRIFLGCLGAAAYAELAPDYERPVFDLESKWKTPIPIAKVELLKVGTRYFVRTTSSEGVTGLAIAKSNLPDSLPIFHTYVAPHFVGKDARKVESLLDSLLNKNYKMPGQAFWVAVAAAEMSLFDLIGKTMKKPLAAIFSAAPRKEVAVYLSGSDRKNTAEQEVDRYLRGFALTGATAMKFKIGGRMSRNEDVYPGRTEKMLELARKRFGDGVTIYADANGSYDAKKGIEIGRLMQSLRCGFFEEPCPWENYEETKQVADALEMPVAFGECDSSLPVFRRLMRNRTFDIVQPDLGYSGGFVRAARIARMAQEAGMPIVNHNTEVGASLAKVVHFAAAMPNAGPFIEYAFDEGRKEPQWYGPHFRVVNGKVKVPEGPGLGIEYDDAYLKKGELITRG